MNEKLLDTDTNPDFIGDYDDNELSRWLETDVTLAELSPEGQKKVREYIKNKNLENK